MNPLRFLNECRNPKAFAWVHKFVINVLIVAIAHVDEKTVKPDSVLKMANWQQKIESVIPEYDEL